MPKTSNNKIENKYIKATTCDNTRQQFIVITEDRLELRLRDFYDALKNTEWKSILGTVITILIFVSSTSPSLATSLLGIPFTYIYWGFVSILIVSSLIFLKTAYKAFKTRKERKIDFVINRMKEEK